MTDVFAPTTQAHRILIAVLAFAMAAAFAFVASAAPADAAKDEKNYSASVSPTQANAGSTTDFTVTFLNEESSTVTQRAGTFLVDFGAADFTVNSASIISASGYDWDVVSTSNNTVVVSAESGGERIGVTDTVQVKVNATAPSAPRLRTLRTDADQEDHGNFKGGNQFTNVKPEPTINVVSVFTPCVENGGNTCQIEGNGFDATLTCGGQCAYLDQGTGGLVADISVNTNGSITMVLTTTGKGPAPGEAFATADGKTLPSCGVNGPPTCVHINRVQGNHTQYTVFWFGDPRFRFR